MKMHTVDKDLAKFYPVSCEEIRIVEEELGFNLPKELKEFYCEFGYGFLGSKKGYPNRIMDPYSVRDFRLKQNDYEFFEDIELYEHFEEDKLIFFEQDESALLSIELGNHEKSKIFYYDAVVATSLQDFLEKMERDEFFFMNM